jgi:hypothetical protein
MGDDGPSEVAEARRRPADYGAAAFAKRIASFVLVDGLRRLACRAVARRAKAGGADRDQTDDLVVANDALYQLSYCPVNQQGGLCEARAGRSKTLFFRTYPGEKVLQSRRGVFS